MAIANAKIAQYTSNTNTILIKECCVMHVEIMIDRKGFLVHHFILATYLHQSLFDLCQDKTVEKWTKTLIFVWFPF